MPAPADLRARADARFEAALQQAGARDPREFYRKQMALLRDENPEAFRRARAYFEDRLIPAVAAEDSDPRAEWLEYGRVLASLAAAGRTVQVDPTGRAAEYARPVAPDHLVLHLPDTPSRPAIIVGIPPKLSPAQKATHDLLVKQSLGS
ncbi:MAG: hypothetical protein AVDCRST_MAG89-2953 [uncultured Gemmatimonadetes bacterium]|uniref:Uncharacterized protein n=1 Tax=uncultured Gemmatimonadota bacterium TaxID=203437 RepID=A0A6J4M1Z6_9BACT|nr:MAG: hypothetical protein AVDCRST_MAG89-2953 [uncultured Gemmatimonadota bacterium]